MSLKMLEINYCIKNSIGGDVIMKRRLLHFITVFSPQHTRVLHRGNVAFLYGSPIRTWELHLMLWSAAVAVGMAVLRLNAPTF